MAQSIPTKEVVGHSSTRTDAGEAWAKSTHDYYPRTYNEHGRVDPTEE